MGTRLSALDGAAAGETLPLRGVGGTGGTEMARPTTGGLAAGGW